MNIYLKTYTRYYILKLNWFICFLMIKYAQIITKHCRHKNYVAIVIRKWMEVTLLGTNIVQENLKDQD